jgi:hypothetical protein
MYFKAFFLIFIFFNENLFAKEKETKLDISETSKKEIKVATLSVIDTKDSSKPTLEEDDEEKEIEGMDKKILKGIPETQNTEIQNVPLTEDEIIKILKEKHRGSVVGKFMDSYPRLIKLTVRATMDKEIRKLWQDTLKDKTRYYLFTGILFLTFGINWAWRRYQISRAGSAWEKIRGWGFRVFLINFSRLAFFILLFEFELRPIWILARNTFNF